MVRNAMCCKCIELEKARGDAAYARGLERGRAPEVARKKAEKEAKEKLEEEQRAARREATANAREKRAKEKRRATLAINKVVSEPAISPTQHVHPAVVQTLGNAPWD